MILLLISRKHCTVEKKNELKKKKKKKIGNYDVFVITFQTGSFHLSFFGKFRISDLLRRTFLFVIPRITFPTDCMVIFILFIQYLINFFYSLFSLFFICSMYGYTKKRMLSLFLSI